MVSKEATSVWLSQVWMLYSDIIKNNNNMNKEQLKVISEMLEKQIMNSEQMWNESESHAKIIGYLQGTIKATITTLNQYSNI